MSIKKKLITTISAFCLVMAILMVGVWALKSTSFDLGGNISFTAKGINATISQGTLSSTGLWVDESDADAKMNEVVINIDKSASQLAEEFESWQDLNLLFNEDGDDVTISFTITNDSKVAGEYIWVEVAVSNGTMSNAYASISTTSTTIAPNASHEFVITFEVIDKDVNASLTGFNLNFDMQLAKNGVETSTLTDLAFTLDEATMKASVKGNNASATSITIPEYVTKDGKLYVVDEIGQQAFKDYSSLKTLTLPNTLITFGAAALSGCSAIQYKVEDGGKYLGSEENPYLVLGGIENTTITEFTSFKEETKILFSSFNGCTKLTNVTIPNTIISVSSATFNGCSVLKVVTLPNTIKELGYSSFQNCTLLETVNIQEGVTIIGDYAFNKCSALKNITLPSTIREICSNAFKYCTSLTGINLPYGITKIQDLTFAASGLKSITIPDSVVSIGKQAFQQCSSLKEINLSKSLGELGDSTFNKCKALESIVIPEGVKALNRLNFYQCSSLKKVVLPNSLTKIGYAVFAESTIQDVNIPYGVTEIGYTAFQECHSLKNINFPETLEYIGDYAFNHCKGVQNETIVIPAGIKQIGGETYDSKNPNSSVIGTHIFYDCGTTALKSFEMSGDGDYYTTIDGVLYREANGVPTVLVSYPANKRDTTYTMPDTVVDAYELSMSRSFYLREIVLSDSFTIKKMTSGANVSWANNLSGMIYIYTGVTTVTCKDTNPNYMSYNGQVYSKDGSILYYAPLYDGTLKSSSETNILSLKAGVKTLFFGSLGVEGSAITSNVTTGNNDANNQFKVFKKVIIPASVTTIETGTITAINYLTWTIEVESGNTAFKVSSGKLAKI